MKVIESISEMKRVRQQLSGAVGFVPTMGYLHEGHISLARQAKAGNPFAVASIFVNPTQFLPHEDYRSYPRNTERDLAMLDGVKTDIVFMPTAEEMYPPGFNTWVDVHGVTERLEGATRPGHFRGVATVVAKLFEVVQPTRAYFGQKDAQQCLVIKKMVTDLNMDLEVVIMPTIREPDGLAMSSRNTYLNPEQRKAATILFEVLMLAKDMWAHGEKSANRLRREMMARILTEPLADIDYVSVADAETLEELETIDHPAVVSMAVKFGKTRLLDNIILK